MSKKGDSAARLPSQSPRQGFPIVGIGASAGGLSAFEAFFSAMPAQSDPDMAFVIVQHMAPDHKSMLTELLRRYTRMEIFEVEDGMLVQPNCVYIIPPNRDMAFLNGKLQLLEPVAPRGQRLPIDFFFRSLAQDQHERAIAIVLSGTGSDGTLGVRAIKGEGGMVMAQTPDSTEYDGMPRSAIATGMVDYELPAAEMPARLIAFAAHAHGREPHEVSAPKVENARNKLFVLLRSHTGFDFSQYKPKTIQRRVERRMAVHQIDSLEDYVKYLQTTPPEITKLFHDLLIGVTRFFRDSEVFQALEQEVLPGLFEDAQGSGGPIRVWVPGCSTGEEAYSIAILLAERQEALKQNFKIQVFATDIDSRAIATARAGRYPASIAADVSEERLARFFGAEPAGASMVPSTYFVHKAIRDLLVFSEQDVTRDPPFSRLDLISCRNLMIYMGGDLQKRLVPLFHYALRPGGLLLLGTSETVGDFDELFGAVDNTLKLYRRKPDPAGARRSAFVPTTMTAGTALSRRERKPAKVEMPLREVTERALLRQAMPAAALINGRGDILYIHGRTGVYLEPAPGEAGVNNILAMAREGLRHELTTALHKAVASGESVSCHGLRVQTNGERTEVDLTIRPVTAGHGSVSEAPLFLVTLESARQGGPAAVLAAGGSSSETGSDSGTPQSAARIVALEQELRVREEFLLVTTEALATSNEELKSSNEEMQSINEELQSTNEELETSKEELQSVNEELSTVNAELETKVLDLSRANNDMNNLMAGTEIATLFVDTDLNILRFTPTATRIINLIASDIGRPLSHIASNLVDYDALISDAQAVIDTLIPKSLDVQTRGDKSFNMRILPYRTRDNVIEGLVLTFVDVTQAKRLQEALRLNEERIRVALKAAPVAIYNQDKELRYDWIHARSSFLDEHALGKTDADLLTKEDAAALTAIKRRVLESGVGTRQQVRMNIGGEVHNHDLTVEPLRNKAGEIIGVTCASLETE